MAVLHWECSDGQNQLTRAVFLPHYEYQLVGPPLSSKQTFSNTIGCIKKEKLLFIQLFSFDICGSERMNPPNFGDCLHFALIQYFF